MELGLNRTSRPVPVIREFSNVWSQDFRFSHHNFYFLGLIHVQLPFLKSMTNTWYVVGKNICPDLIRSNKTRPANLGVRSCQVWTLICPVRLSPTLLIGKGSNHQSLMLVTSHVRSAFCTLTFIKSYIQTCFKTVQP